MPGSTPNRHYPYPLGTDTIYPPRDFKALAEAVDADFSAQVTATDLAAALAGYLRLTGGAVTGAVSISQAGSAVPLSLRNVGNVPALEFRSQDGATRYALLQMSGGNLTYTVDPTTGFHLFRVGATERFRVSPTGGILSGALTVTGAATVGAGLAVTGNASVSGDLAVNDINASGHGTFTGDVTANDETLTGSLTANGTARVGGRAYIGGDGNQLNLIDTVVTTAGTSYDVVLNFYGQGTTTAPGTRAGYLGYGGTNRLVLKNEAAAGDILISVQTGGEIQFSPNGVFNGVMAGNAFIWGKAVSDLANPGIEMFGATSGAEGSVRSTTAAANIQNFLCRHEGSQNATGQAFIHFYRGSTIGGSVTQNGLGVLFNETSDYRLKNDLGPVENPLARLMELQPKRLSWKSDNSQFDGFFAHEVATVVPNAVTGEKDAVLPDTDEFDPGGMSLQQLDQSKLIALLVAAVQELAAEVAALKAGA